MNKTNILDPNDNRNYYPTNNDDDRVNFQSSNIDDGLLDSEDIFSCSTKSKSKERSNGLLSFAECRMNDNNGNTNSFRAPKSGFYRISVNALMKSEDSDAVKLRLTKRQGRRSKRNVGDEIIAEIDLDMDGKILDIGSSTAVMAIAELGKGDEVTNLLIILLPF